MATRNEQTTANNPQVLHVPAGKGERLWIVGDTYTYKATSETTNGSLFLMEASVPPQGGPPPHIHHANDEAFWVLEGEVEVRNGDQFFTATTGSFVFIPRGALHGFKNVGTQPMRMLIMAVPAGFEGYFRAVGRPAGEGAAPPTTPEEVAKAIAEAPNYDSEMFPL
jgi:quercetin dioxygenase-like cupin family protein